MNKPVILTVDDDPEVLQAVGRDLRQQYADRYRIVRAESGSAALEAVQQLKLGNTTIALFLADQRMPQIGGVEFIQRAAEVFPEAKRVLLTAYADSEAAINAINDARLDYYLLKPWDPPQEKLYPILDDLLEDWRAHFHPEFHGTRVVGDRWSADSHRIKDFLARNHIPYRWLDIERDLQGEKLLTYAGACTHDLPVVVYPNGSHHSRPSNVQIAEQLKLQTRATNPLYDLAIVGGGPAGLAAAVYGASEGLRTVMIEREAPGGQAGTSSHIENYLGFPVGLSGSDLARRGVTQAKRFGVEILTPQEVVGIDLDNDYPLLTLRDSSQLTARAVILALGVSWRRLDIPGLDRLTGAGVYYGAVQAEAIACKGEEVFMVGGANSAGEGALYFAHFAKKVTMLVRGDSLTQKMSQYLVDRIEATDNIEVWTHSSVVEAKGDSSLEALIIRNSRTDEEQIVPAKSLFILVGSMPQTDWLDGLVQRDEKGFILTGSELSRNGTRPLTSASHWTLERDPYFFETNIPGIFAVGDVRCGSVKRVASGVGEGSMCVLFVRDYLKNQ